MYIDFGVCTSLMQVAYKQQLEEQTQSASQKMASLTKRLQDEIR
jgi:hypothetical protein